MEAEHIAFRVAAMQVLGAWALLNIAGGAVGAWATRSRPLRAFFLGNAGWNVVNLAIAVGGGLAALQHAPGTWEGVTLLREVELFLRILLVNAGLDVGYVASGVIAALWGRERREPWRLGIGSAVALQGVFLFVFDVVISTLTHRQLEALWVGVT